MTGRCFLDFGAGVIVGFAGAFPLTVWFAHLFVALSGKAEK